MNACQPAVSFGSVTTFICISICLCKYLNTLLPFAFQVLILLIGQFEIKEIIVHSKDCESLALAECSLNALSLLYVHL